MTNAEMQKRIDELEKQGLTTSDAIGVVMAEDKKVVKVCNSCGYPIDSDGFCTAPLSKAD